MTQTAIERKKAKLDHRMSKINRPQVFEERRVELATEFTKMFTEKPPIWGSFKFKFLTFDKA